ncbi:MAG: hypothetical protein L3J65_09965 [Robiginitomaculum sp.]|nr:hypothetical protein [Robiginitomaculum sp.]
MTDELPCERLQGLKEDVVNYADELKTKAHQIGSHGLSEQEFYESGIFEGAIQRIRGQLSASMGKKKEFVAFALNHMLDGKFIQEWEEAGNANRHDYSVTLNSGRIAAIELKGCLDGNNTNISVRPPHADEFILWSVCQNKAADPRHNLWSGIHVRISADIVSDSKRIDGLIVWDYLCNTAARRCPKIESAPSRITELGPYQLPPPCIYTFPATIPSPRNNPKPPARQLQDVEILRAFHCCFMGNDDEVNHVEIEAAMKGVEVVRQTTITRNSKVRRQSAYSAIKRS